MKKFLKRAGKAAVNIKTAPIRAKAKLLEKGARAVGAKGVADMAGRMAQPLNKGGMPKYGHGGMSRNMYKDGGVAKAMKVQKPN